MTTPTPHINAPTMPANSTYADTATYYGAFVSNIMSAGNDFLAALQSDKQADFFSVGNLPTLSLSEVDFTQQLSSADVKFPAPILPGFSIQHDMDKLAAMLAPTPPTLAAVDIAVPTFDSAAPVITLPALPSTDVGAAPTDAPSVVDAALPDAPVVTLPNVPTFEELQLPTAPTYTLPDFLASAPQNLLSPPTNTFAYVDVGYTSDLRDPLVAKLLDQLANGGYGIEPANELALWNRARDRDTQASLTRVEEVKRTAASTSFPMPQGSYYASIEAANQELAAKVASFSREVALKRADLYVDNRRFTFEQVHAHETRAIALYTSVQERALNAAKAQVEMAVTVYDATVKNYQAQLEGYKTEAQVFEARIRAQLGKAELFKTQVEAESLRVNFNRAKIEMYNAQLQGINTVVDVYKSRLAAVETFARIQAQKLEAFRLRVQTYGERVKAKEAEYNIYTAAVRGQLANLDVFKSQIEAYNAGIAGRTARANIIAASNEQLIHQYEAQVKQYEETLKTTVERVKAALDEERMEVQFYSGRVDAYRAFVDTMIKGADTRIANLKVNHEQLAAVYKAEVEKVRFKLEQLAKQVELTTSVDSKGAEFIRTLLGAAMSNVAGLTVSSSTL